MGKLSDDIEKVEANLKQIASHYEDLKKNNPFSSKSAKDIASSAQEMQILEDALTGAAAEVREMDKSLETLVKRFKSANNEVKQSSEGLKSMNQILSQSASTAEKLRNHQQGISLLSVKQLKKEKEKIKAAQSRLSIAESILKQEETSATGKKLTKIKAALKVNESLQKDINNEYKNTNDHLDKEISKEKQIQKSLGVTGGVLKGISKIPILGDVFQADEAVEAMEGHLREGGSAVGALGKGFKNIGSQMIGGILNPANLIVGAFGMMVSIFKDLDGGAGDYAKGMNTTYGEAMATRGETKQSRFSYHD